MQPMNTLSLHHSQWHFRVWSTVVPISLLCYHCFWHALSNTSYSSLLFQLSRSVVVLFIHQRILDAFTSNLTAAPVTKKIPLGNPSRSWCRKALEALDLFLACFSWWWCAFHNPFWRCLSILFSTAPARESSFYYDFFSGKKFGIFCLYSCHILSFFCILIFSLPLMPTWMMNEEKDIIFWVQVAKAACTDLKLEHHVLKL